MRPTQNTCYECHAAYSRERYQRLKTDPEWLAKERERGRIKGRRQWREGSGKVRHLRFRLKEHGITLEDYERMRTAQRGLCAICSEPCCHGGELSIDHCHETGAVRGLLCRHCNVGLGYFRDRPDLLGAAINYLEGHYMENNR